MEALIGLLVIIVLAIGILFIMLKSVFDKIKELSDEIDDNFQRRIDSEIKLRETIYDMGERSKMIDLPIPPFPADKTYATTPYKLNVFLSALIRHLNLELQGYGGIVFINTTQKNLQKIMQPFLFIGGIADGHWISVPLSHESWHVLIPPDPLPVESVVPENYKIAQEIYCKVRLNGDHNTYVVFLEKSINNATMIEMLIDGYKGGKE